MATSRILQSRVLSDAKSPAFLYIPKARAVARDNWDSIAEFLRILDGYRRIPWKDAQPLFVADLNEKRLIGPYRDHDGKFSAVGRMQLPVWRNLGFAWINRKGVPEVTEIGKRFIRGREKYRRELLSMQVHRYQFWNPTCAAHFEGFRTLPVLSLYRLLQNTGWYISREEFLLLGSRIRSLSDATEIASLIDELRVTTDEERAKLYGLARALSAESHTRSETGTTYGKVERNLAYIWRFLGLSKYIIVERDGIRIPPRHRRKVREVIDASYEAEIIDYRSAQDWLARYGEVPKKEAWETPWATAGDAREYYQRIGRIEAAAEALSREDTKMSPEHVDEYRRVQIRESVLEDILEHNLEELEPGLRLVGRQFPTAVGPIDLLAQDQNDSYVVIELKRGRTGDRVIGQITRYLGWVTERMVHGDKTQARAIVVGREYDAGFASAITQISRISPYTYDIGIRFEPWSG